MEVFPAQRPCHFTDTEAAEGDSVKAARPDPRYLVASSWRFNHRIRNPANWFLVAREATKPRVVKAELAGTPLKAQRPPWISRYASVPLSGVNHREAHWPLRTNNGNNSRVTTNEERAQAGRQPVSLASIVSIVRALFDAVCVFPIAAVTP